MRALLLALAATAPATAAADRAKPTLATLAPARDARQAIAIGPAGQIYRPDGKGAWIRTQAGGVAVEIVAAATARGTVIAAAKAAPPFKLKAGVWTSIALGSKPNAILGAGPRVVAADGKTVFVFDTPQPKKLADAPGPVLALAASPTGVVVATDQGLFKLAGATFRPVKRAPTKVVSLVSDRWALLDHGAFDLRMMKPIAWPTGLRVSDAVVQGGTLIAVATNGKAIELLTVVAGKLTRDPIPLLDPAPIVGVVADPARRVVIALSDGTLVVRDHGTWTSTMVREELPAAKPGPAPAASM